jgi:hypothetical protein
MVSGEELREELLARLVHLPCIRRITSCFFSGHGFLPARILS